MKFRLLFHVFIFVSKIVLAFGLGMSGFAQSFTHIIAESFFFCSWTNPQKCICPVKYANVVNL